MPLSDNFTVGEVKHAVAELKACLDDAKRHGTLTALEQEHLPRLVYILTNNEVIAEMLKWLPKVSLYLDDAEPPFRDYNIPIEPKARLSKQIATLIEIGEDRESLADFRNNSFDPNAGRNFWDNFFEPFIRDLTQYVVSQQDDFIERKKLNKNGQGQKMNAPKNYALDLFISHSSTDKQLASSLIEFLRIALAIPADRIRCTSVDGFKLTGGAKTEFELKKEIRDSRCFIGLITPDSLQSQFVLFELGARWGLDEHFVPILGCGIAASTLRPPLSNLNALNSASKNDMEQLVHELAKVLGSPAPLPATYEKQLSALLKIGTAYGTPLVQTVASAHPKGDDIDKTAKDILKMFFDTARKHTASQICAQFQLKPNVGQYHLDVLSKKNLISIPSFVMGGGRELEYKITSVGRAYCVENGLAS